MAGSKYSNCEVGENAWGSETYESEQKPPSPAKTESSEDTLETLSSSVDAKKEDCAKEVDLLPDFIRARTYSNDPVKADKQLWDDIRKEDENTGESFLDQKFLKYIFIDAETRKAFVQMPCDYHEEVVKTIKAFVNVRSTRENPVFADGNGGMDLKDKGGRKYPDVFIFGQDRTEYDEYELLGTKRRRLNVGGQRKIKPMNPNAIVEVSWTNNIRTELEKFGLQINQCNSDELGTINVGYLIKFIPQTELPNEENPNRPLVGIDVYRMVAGEETPVPDEMFLKWRHGEDYPTDLKFTGEELGQGRQGEGLSIPFRGIVGALTRYGVVFEAPNRN